MLDTEQLQAVGTVVGAACASIVIYFAARREAKKPAAPPPERPLTENAVKQELAELRSRIERAHHLASDDRESIARQLDRVERTTDRIWDKLDRLPRA